MIRQKFASVPPSIFADRVAQIVEIEYKIVVINAGSIGAYNTTSAPASKRLVARGLQSKIGISSSECYSTIHVRHCRKTLPLQTRSFTNAA